jgi:hypothetical protein
MSLIESAVGKTLSPKQAILNPAAFDKVFDMRISDKVEGK